MIELRPAGPDDAESIALLHARSWRETYRGAFTDAFLDGDLIGERLRVWQERLADPPPNQLVQVAIDGACLQGFVCAYGAHDPEWGSFIDNIHVAREAKRSGIGSSLMRRTGARLDRDHADLGIYLWVLEMNSSGREFYGRLGACNSGVSTMETHGGAIVRSCRYAWPNAGSLSAA